MQAIYIFIRVIVRVQKLGNDLNNELVHCFVLANDELDALKIGKRSVPEIEFDQSLVNRIAYEDRVILLEGVINAPQVTTPFNRAGRREHDSLSSDSNRM